MRNCCCGWRMPNGLTARLWCHCRSLQIYRRCSLKPSEQNGAGKAAIAAVQQKSTAGMQQVSAQEEPAKPFVPDNKAAQSSLKERSRSEERRVGKECRSRWSP